MTIAVVLLAMAPSSAARSAHGAATDEVRLKQVWLNQVRQKPDTTHDRRDRRDLRDRSVRLQPDRAARPPNFIVVFADDLGYADIGPFSSLEGPARPRTPNLDRMAAEGVRLTNFYVAQAVCSASRAALLTGSYSNRIGITGALNHRATHGINTNEITIAELLKTRGYATAIYGKWHLGHERPFLPLQHGFDEYLGLPYSNDMWPRHPQQKGFYPELPLIDGDKVVKLDPDQSQLTTTYTERAVRFVERNRDTPFFLYLAHAMPHVPLFVSNKHRNTTAHGLYGDVIAEIDWSVGQVLDAVRRAGLDDNTLVIFTSDNGPWLSYGNHAGSAKGFREGKGTTFEGGVRVPFVARWPGRIPKGATGAVPAMTIDLLPTFARLAGAEVPHDRIIDGRDMWPLLANTANAAPPHEALFFYWGTELHAIRSGRWKLHLPHPYQSLERAGSDGSPGVYVRRELELSLFDLDADRAESTNIADRHPEVVTSLLEAAERARDDLGDSLTKRVGKNVRPAGTIESTQPARRPNVLLIMADDLNDDMATFGHGIVKTPNLDRLAARGVRFDRAYTQFPLCSPSRVSLLTGLRPDSTGVHDLQTDFRTVIPNVMTLPQLFKSNGYVAARVGKIYHYGNPGQIGTSGLDDSASWDAVINPRGIDKDEEAKLTNFTPARGLGSALAYYASPAADADHTDGKVAAETIALLEKHKDRPFFIGAGFYRPHCPFIAPQKYFDMYPLDRIPMPAAEPDSRAPPAAWFTTPPNWGLGEREQRETIRAYYASISFLDANIGRILDALERLRLLDDTIVVFVSDHGYHLGEKGQWMKQTLFERSARTPLIVAGAGVASKGRATSRIVELLDLYPTLADVAGLAAPQGLQGRSLRPLLRDPNASWEHPALTQVRRGPAASAYSGYSVRTEKWRYTEWDGGTRGVELYDETGDPAESNNLASDAKYTQVVSEMQQLLRRLIAGANRASPAPVR
jgi:choline-sulfatase